MQVQSCLTLCATPWTDPQPPLFMGFSRQEYWSGLPFPSPGYLPNPGIEPRVSCIGWWILYQWGTREAWVNDYWSFNELYWDLSQVYEIPSLYRVLRSKQIKNNYEAPILWPPDAKNQLTGKDPDAGKDWKQEDKGTTEDEMVGWHHRLKGHEFEKTWEIVKAGKPGMLQSMGSQRVGHSWGTEKEQIQNNRAWVPNGEIWIKSWKMEPESRSLASPWYFAGYVFSGKGTSLLKNWPMKLDRIPLKGME